jgi:hypothetical protein
LNIEICIFPASGETVTTQTYAERGQPDNFIRKGVEQYKSVASIDRSSYEASRTEEVFIRRYNFWRGILKLTPKTKAQQ